MEADKTQKLLKEKLRGKGAEGDSPETACSVRT